MKIYFLILLLLISIFSLSCQSKIKELESEPEQKTKIPFFDPIELGAYNKDGKLSINARFSECGEWGGHHESIIIYADSNMNIHARYRVYPSSCNSLYYYYEQRNLNPLSDTTINIDDQKTQSINEYIHRMIDSKISERFPAHAGSHFSVVKSDSTLIIHVYDYGDSYKKLVFELFE